MYTRRDLVNIHYEHRERDRDFLSTFNGRILKFNIRKRRNQCISAIDPAFLQLEV
jgi:hypothetical protein